MALQALLALEQAGRPLRIAQVGSILDVPFSSADRALEILVADGLVERRGATYVPVSSPRTAIAVQFAVAMLHPADFLATVARANPAVEFCGRDDQGLLVVVRRFVDPVDEGRLMRAISDLREVVGVAVEVTDKSMLRDRLLTDDGPRRRALGMEILAGSTDRTFPDRTRHGDPASPPLRALTPRLALVSQRRLRDLAKRYHLRRISAFGSATREDFRPDSDVDLLVEPEPGHRPRLGEIVRLNNEAESLFGRDVDLLSGPVTDPALRARIERDAVVLYDAAR
jgi:predicted nucleotidyltransferase